MPTAATSARSWSAAPASVSVRRSEIWREELGVDVEIEAMEFGDYLAVLDSRPPGIFTVNWIADYPSPHAIYGLLLQPGAGSNYGDVARRRVRPAARGRGSRPGVGDRRRLRRGRRLRRRAGAGHPVVVRRDVVAGRRRAARARQPDDRPRRLREGVVGRLTRWLAPPLLAGALLVFRADAAAALRRLRASSSAESTYGGRDPLRGRPSTVAAPERLELLIRTPGGDGSLVVPVEPSGATAEYVWDTSVDHVVPEHAHHLPVARDRRRRGRPLRRRGSIRYVDDRPGLDWQSVQLGEATVHWYGDGEDQALLLRRAERGRRRASGAAARQRAGRPGRRLRLQLGRGLLRRPGSRRRGSGPVRPRTPSCARSSCGTRPRPARRPTWRR